MTSRRYLHAPALPQRSALIRSAALCVTLVGACSADAGMRNAELDICRYEVAFADEFDDLSIASRELKGKRWTAHTPWNGDFGDAVFSNPRPDGRPFAVSDGKLRITAFRDEAGRWRSGLIAAGDASGAAHGVKYGYFEARMRLPPGPGTWPAFWLMSPEDPPGKSNPSIEIDVVEYYGHMTDRYVATWHVWYPKPEKEKTRSEGEKIRIPDQSLVGGFHTYGVRVEPQTMTFYLDRKPVWQAPTPPELKTPLYPLVNLALGSGYSIENTPDPSVLEVDYVRVYRPRAPGKPGGCDQPSASSDHAN
ncbi:MAG TPA: glycoside hydrolase family 16 protein [Novosphingobium sp.]|nr:glycoside hydrolase family 16 protein [Novosphingobium sp.]